MRTQLAVPDNDFLSADFYNQAFTLHGTVMMFLFAVPIFEAVAIFLLPPMLGARELPFPRLGAFGFWSFLIGGVFVCGSIFFDAAPSSGWFMYPPLATDKEYSGIGADIWLLGLSFIEVASIAAAVELIVGIMKCRAPGMRINLMPLFAWYLLIVAGMILFAFPPLIAGDLLFEMQRMFDWPFFDAERGGDPLLWQHLFWIFGHPEVYIIFLPAIALMAMIVPTFAQRPIVGYSWIVLAAVGTGFLSFGLWVHHMFATGLPQISLAFFSAASEAVAIPTGVQIFVFIATMLAGRVIFSVPMLFGAGGIAIFVIGGLTGVMVALAPFDWQAHDTYFVVAHLHYVLIGGMLFPLIAGLYYYYPLINARMLSDAARPHRLLADVRRLQRRLLPDASDRPARHAAPRLHLSGGHRLGLAEPHLDGRRLRLRRRRRWSSSSTWCGRSTAQPRGEQNPWNAGTLEWLNEPEENWGVRSIPLIESRYPLWDQQDLMREVNDGRYYLADARGRPPRDAGHLRARRRPDAVPARRRGRPSSPIVSAALLGGVFVALTFEWWIIAAASPAVGTLAAILWWLWTGTGEIPEKKAKDVGLGLQPAALRIRAQPRSAGGRCSSPWSATAPPSPASSSAISSTGPSIPDFTAGQAGPGLALADGRTCAVRCRMGRHARGARAERAGLGRRRMRLALAARLPADARGLGGRLRRAMAPCHAADRSCLSGDRLDPGHLGARPCGRRRRSCSSIAWRAASPAG